MAVGIAGKREELRLLENLAKDKGYLFLNGLMQQKADVLQPQILFTPLMSLDSCLPQEYKKGLLEGYLAWEPMRTTTMEVLEQEINSLKELEDASSSEEDSEVTGSSNDPVNRAP